ncbi:MAG: lactate utilization protein [Bacillota bacterium]
MEELLSKFSENNINAYFVEDRKAALKLAISLIPEKAKIAMGNSLTLRETGIFDEVTSGKYNVINQFAEGISPEENLRRRKEGMLSDVYLTSSNAVTSQGELINIDGKGNRVAAMLFGPDKVIVVVGRNKIVPDEAAAWERLRKYTAPRLAKMLGRQNPCCKTGECSDCKSLQRICRMYTIIRSQMPADKDRLHVIIVNEDLGI